jgi:hypothetical protein
MKHMVLKLPNGPLHCWWNETQVIATDRKVTQDEMDLVKKSITNFSTEPWFVDRAKDWGYV